jgi:4-hydroxy-3-methylbut-2-en-1-yl diphosphate reductase
MKVSIDPFAGFCFGVKRAIGIAEEELRQSDQLYCLGEIVHNEEEIKRLEKSGLNTIKSKGFGESEGNKVLLRAHGEPPLTYKVAAENNIEIIDATCPVVLKIQKKVKVAWEEMKQVNGQVVLFGKKNHPEVTGLAGQTEDNAIIIENSDDLYKIDMQRAIRLFVQTTKSIVDFNSIVDLISVKLRNANPDSSDFKYYNTICGQVSQRIPKLKKFCREHDIIIFVSGKNSSNGKQLFAICKAENNKSYLISSEIEINQDWFSKAESVGISGATSVPEWLMKKIAGQISGI